MLAVGSSRNTRDGCGEGYSIEVEDVFPDFSGDNLLESIDFDDLFDGMNDDEDALPALEIMEPDNNDVNIILSDGTFMFEKDSPHLADYDHENNSNSITSSQEEDDKVNSGNSGINGSSGLTSSSCLNNQGDEIVSKRDESAPLTKKAGKKSSKNHQGKKKVKVDWTPELHKRFVQAVEQLGVDKAVPSRILELMGIDCLTRHNIASHLQKYRSHRKHLLAREAEAASWTQRRQMYCATTGAGGGGCKRDITSPWLAPTIGFPHMAPVPHFRPLHVWGHPSIDQSLRHIWPKHLAPSPSPPPPLWPPAPQSPQLPPPPDPASFWRSRHQRVPNTTPRTPCIPVPPAPFAQTRFAAPPVQGIPPQTMYKVDPSPGVAQTAPTGQTCPTLPFDFHPSKESIDAAIEDVLSKPWLPLPLGLKPPSADSVVVELHRQGIEKLPTTCA